MKIPEALNLSFLESQYRRYQSDPQSVSREWQLFFYGFDIGLQRGVPGSGDCANAADAKVAELIHRYRDLGHLLACMDPPERLSHLPSAPGPGSAGLVGRGVGNGFRHAAVLFS